MNNTNKQPEGASEAVAVAAIEKTIAEGLNGVEGVSFKFTRDTLTLKTGKSFYGTEAQLLLDFSWKNEEYRVIGYDISHASNHYDKESALQMAFLMTTLAAVADALELVGVPYSK